MRKLKIVSIVVWVLLLMWPAHALIAQVIGGDPCIVLPGTPLPDGCEPPCDPDADPDGCEEPPCDPDTNPDAPCAPPDPCGPDFTVCPIGDPPIPPDDDDSEEQPQEPAGAPEPLDIELLATDVSYIDGTISACFNISNMSGEEVSDVQISFYHSPRLDWYGIGSLQLAPPIVIGSLDLDETIHVCVTIEVTQDEIDALQNYLDQYHSGVMIDGNGYIWAHITAGTQPVDPAGASNHISVNQP